MENNQTVNFNDLPTTYDAKATEERIYKFWEDNECFKADAKSPKKPKREHRICTMFSLYYVLFSFFQTNV